MGRTSKKIIIKESTGKKIIQQSRMRMLCVGFFFVLCFASISFRMIEVAVVKNPKALTVTIFNPDDESENEEIEIKTGDLALQRGDIVDRNGVLLATSLMTASVFVNPKEIKNINHAAKLLAKTLSIDKKKIIRNLKSKKSFVWIKRNLTPKEQQKVNSLGIPGVYFTPEERRVYPYGQTLSHLLGYVNLDNKGLAGIERKFDRRLRESVLNHDPLQLSVDVRLQSMLRTEMQNTIKKFKAIGGVGVVLDIKSGELLSMVSLPDFNPHKPPRCNKKLKPEECRKFNRVSFGGYEMGSTFKSFTMAMGLEYGVTGMRKGYDATHPLKVSTFTIRDAHGKKRWLTVPEIYAYSSNIGTAKIALDVGEERQRKVLKKLGMFEKVNIEIPERASPRFPKKWKEINTVTISYGHGISVTPLHLVQGIASLVNGGRLERLTLLKNGNRKRSEGERIIREETSKNIRRLMRLVVSHGTGGKADVPGYRVGGKTGTAEKVQPNGKYDPDAKMASFIATFPVDDPKYVVLVMIDEPKGNKSTYGYATGGWIAAPVVGEVIARMGPMYGIKPRYDVPEDDAEKFWVYRKKDKRKKRRSVEGVGSMMEKRYISAVY